MVLRRISGKSSSYNAEKRSLGEMGKAIVFNENIFLDFLKYVSIEMYTDNSLRLQTNNSNSSAKT